MTLAVHTIYLDLAVSEVLFGGLILWAACNRARGYARGELHGLVSNVFWISVASASGVLLLWHAFIQLRPML